MPNAMYVFGINEKHPLSYALKVLGIRKKLRKNQNIWTQIPKRSPTHDIETQIRKHLIRKPLPRKTISGCFKNTKNGYDGTWFASFHRKTTESPTGSPTRLDANLVRIVPTQNNRVSNT